MSKITNLLLKNINYKNVKEIRNSNFSYIHSHIGKFNELVNFIDSSQYHAPLAYPFMNKSKDLRNILIKNKIYIAKYWSNVLSLVDNNMIENYFVNNILPIPIDQRYSIRELNYIIKIIKNHV
jgi:hypothetical protein